MDIQFLINSDRVRWELIRLSNYEFRSAMVLDRALEIERTVVNIVLQRIYNSRSCWQKFNSPKFTIFK